MIENKEELLLAMEDAVNTAKNTFPVSDENEKAYGNIGSDIWIAKQYNLNHMVKRKEADDHVKIQKEIEERIEEIKRQNND